MDIIRELENEQLKSEVTPFNVGDTIRVYAKVVEGTKRKDCRCSKALLSKDRAAASEKLSQ